MFIFPVFGRFEQKYWKFKVSLCYIDRPYLNKIGSEERKREEQNGMRMRDKRKENREKKINALKLKGGWELSQWEMIIASLGPTLWKERSNNRKLSSDLHSCTMPCASTQNKYSKNFQENVSQFFCSLLLDQLGVSSILNRSFTDFRDWVLKDALNSGYKNVMRSRFILCPETPIDKLMWKREVHKASVLHKELQATKK